MNEVLLFSTVISPVILGLVELCKRTINIKATYIPLVAFVVGLIVGFISQPFTELDLVLRLWSGGLAGLSATGLFEMMNNRNKEKGGF